MSLLGICQFKDRRAAEAGLFAAAFAADPQLADDLQAGHRYRAARAAAVAGCGRGADGSRLGAMEQQRWRQQARAWLRLDLDALTKRLETAGPAERDAVHKTLARWREDPDLDRLRRECLLKLLPAAEAQDCRALWSDLDARLGLTPLPK